VIYRCSRLAPQINHSRKEKHTKGEDRKGLQTISFPRENIIGKPKSSIGEMILKLTHFLFPNNKCPHAECIKLLFLKTDKMYS
jgi:hypothetical protein